MHTPAHHAQYSSSKIPPSRGDLEFNNDKQDGFAYLCLLMFHRYVHLKQPPFSNITMFGNHESHCGMNGGFTYIQVHGCPDWGSCRVLRGVQLVFKCLFQIFLGGVKPFYQVFNLARRIPMVFQSLLRMGTSV